MLPFIIVVDSNTIHETLVELPLNLLLDLKRLRMVKGGGRALVDLFVWVKILFIELI